MSFIKNKNEENKSSSKNFFIIIKYSVTENNNKEQENIKNIENIAINYLNECYFKVKDSLSRCGNLIYDINSKKDAEKTLLSVFDAKNNEY